MADAILSVKSVCVAKLWLPISILKREAVSIARMGVGSDVGS